MTESSLQDYLKIIQFEAVKFLSRAKTAVNEQCQHLEAWQIITLTAFATYTLIRVRECFGSNCDNVSLKQSFLGWFRRLPFIRTIVEKKLAVMTLDVQKQVRDGFEDKIFLQKLPQKGLPPENVIEEVSKYLGYGTFAWSDGRVSGAVYHGNDKKLSSLVTEVYRKTAYENPLHADVFPGIRFMEAEIIRMTCSLFNGDSSTCGSVATGGTESIFLVCKAYRDYARFEKGIKCPNMVIPVTAHAAFDKAATILKIELKHVKIDPLTTKVNVNAMRRTVNSNTCMLVGSAPAYPHGSIDPIEEIAKIGQDYDIPVHVDSCLGGFIVPFMRKAGFDVPKIDFSVPGVTSISADTHKYAFAPKGTSVIMYRNSSYRHYQYFVQPNWPGGIYGTPTLSGSRSGGVIATCWATMLYHGEEFYIDATKRIISVAKLIEEKLRAVKGIYILGKPEVSVVAIGSKDFDIYRLSSALTKKGWVLNILQFPSAFHFCCTLQHTQQGVADAFVADVIECTQVILQNPQEKAKGTAAVYGLAQQIPDRSLVSELVWTFLDCCASTEQAE